MIKTAGIYSIIVFTLCALSFSATQAQDELDQDIKTLEEEFYANSDAEVQARLLRDFLDKYPETRYTASLLYLASRVIGHELDDAEGMLELTESLLSRVEGEELRRVIKIEQIQLYGSLGKLEKVRSIAAELSATGELPYVGLHALADAYLAADDFESAVEYYRRALTFASEEVFLKSNPAYASYPSGVDNIVRDRKTENLTGIAWSQVNLGKIDDGLATFAEAEKSAEFNLFGAPEGKIYTLWGRALLMKGDTEGAIEKFAPGALTRKDAEALVELKTLYVARNGSDEGFSDYLWQLREKLSVTLADFSLSDYDGEQHSLSDLKGAKATLLVFWHPT